MRKLLIAVTLCVMSPVVAMGALTIEECVKKAEANYPLIRQYDLLAATCDIDLSDVGKSWLPRVGLVGQVTAQNVVPAFPEVLTGVLQQMGQQVRGLGKVQYKAGVEVSQTLWDGGVSRVRRDIARSRQSVESAALDVELYTVRQRVENIFFAILLVEEQIAMNRVTCDLLDNNFEKLKSMYRNGVAMQSDVDMVEAQMLALQQTIDCAVASVAGYRRVLELFIGESVDGCALERPVADLPENTLSARPELDLFARRLELNSVSERMCNTDRMPKIGLFVQAGYGYPGLDYFKSMMNRSMSFNLISGVTMSWNIDSFYTGNNRHRRSAIEARRIETDKETFLFNTDMLATSQSAAIAGLRTAMQNDAKIIALRGNVRRAAESQLANGVIDTTGLLTKISDENMARLTAGVHEIQLLQEIYRLKYTLNR
ncbi:MAG: TolC family protein [Muribaculum sp.]|nr:TolC family protein [Muribaculum sp.]